MQSANYLYHNELPPLSGRQKHNFENLRLQTLAGLAFLLVAALTGCPNLTNMSDRSRPSVDASTLETGIVTANAEKTGVTVADSPAEVALGLHYVTRAEWDNFDNAITEALAVQNDATATQTDVNEAIETLVEAVAIFKTAKQDNIGTKSADFTGTEKDTLIQTATAAASGVKTSQDGSDIAPNELWIAPAVLDSLNNAINALSGELSDQNYLALATALNTFNEAKQTGKKAKEIRITGLPAELEGAEIQVDLFTTKNIKEDTTICGGYGTAQDGIFRANLYSFAGDQVPWNGSGSYYVVFTTSKGDAYITRNVASFNTDSTTISYAAFEETDIAPDPVDAAGHITGTISFSDYTGTRPEAYINAYYSFFNWIDERGDVYTVDSNGNFAIPFTQSFLDSLQGADQTLHFRLYVGSGDSQYHIELEPKTVGASNLSGDKINVSSFGTVSLADLSLSGAVSFADMPSPMPHSVSVSARYGDFTWINYGQRYAVTVSGAAGTWTIPRDDAFLAALDSGDQAVTFSLYVQPGQSGDTFAIAEKTVTVSKENLDSVDLGTVSLAYLSLSGTLTVSYNGNPASRVRIIVDTAQEPWLAYTILNSPAPNTPWSIILPPFDSPTELSFRIIAYDSSNTELFSKDAITTIPGVSGGSISNIAINYDYTVSLPPSPTPLTLGAWTDGELAAPAQEDWYSFTASGGTYYVSWNDYDAHTEKTGNIKVTAHTGDGAIISGFSEIDAGWATPQAITGKTGIIYLKVEGLSENNTGTYAIKYSQSSDSDSLSAPTGLSASASGDGVSLFWNSVDGAVLYRIYRSDSPDGPYSLSSVSYSTSFIDFLITANTTYYYKVSALAFDGSESPQSDYVSGILLAITGLVVTDSNASGISLSWDSLSEAISYNVYRGDAIMGIPTIGGAKLIDSSSSTSYTDSTVASYSYYYYQVSAVFSGGSESPLSSYVSATSMSAPTNLMVTGSTASSISLSWDSVEGAVSYHVYRSDSADGTYEKITTWSVSNTSYTDSKLDSNTRYYYKVAATAFNMLEGMTGPRSAYVSGMTISGGDSISAPTGLNATDSGDSIYLSWNGVDDANYYNIYRSAYEGDYTYRDTTQGADSNTSYIDSALSAGTYYYKVSAVDSSGNASPLSDYAYATVSAVISAPTGLNATDSGDSIYLSWNGASDALYYTVYRNDSAYGTYSKITDYHYSTSYIDSALSAGTYYYKVSAVDSSGNASPLSDYAYATVSASEPPPGGEDTLSISGGSGKFSVVVTTTTISQENYTSAITTGLVATGMSSNGSAVTLTWTYGDNKTGSYNVLVTDTGNNTSRYQNGVNFSNGSASVSYGSMTELVIEAFKTGSLTINGLPEGTFTVYVFAAGTDISSFAAALSAILNPLAIGGVVASGNTFTITGMSSLEPVDFDASGNLPVLLLNPAGSMMDVGGSIPMYSWATVNFSDGSATASYSSFTGLFMVPSY
jgi:fibronectin type 3 domain-containing protein